MMAVRTPEIIFNSPVWMQNTFENQRNSREDLREIQFRNIEVEMQKDEAHVYQVKRC